MNGYLHKLFKGILQVKYENRLDGTYAYTTTTSVPYVSLEDRIEQLMTLVGDGTGASQMIDNEDIYYVAPPPGEAYVLSRMNVYLEGGQSKKFDANMYGSNAALATGIVMTVNNPSSVIKLLTPQPIQKIGHWSLLAGIDVFFTDFPSGKSDMAVVRWSFDRGGGDIVLNGDKEESLRCTIIDPLGSGGAGLESHLMQVQGRKFNLG